MAVHVPLSVEAQMEARLLMMAPNNIFSPSSGKPIITPTQDITLGCYYLTAESAARRRRRGRNAAAAVRQRDRSRVRDGGRRGENARPDPLANPDFGKETDLRRRRNDASSRRPSAASSSAKSGRPELGFSNKAAGKKQLGDLIWRCYQVAGQQGTVEMLDKLKELGFREATKAGVSIGIDDMIIPKEKETRSSTNAHKQIKEVEKQYRKGIITDGERYNKIIDIWTHCTRPDFQRHVPHPRAQRGHARN